MTRHIGVIPKWQPIFSCRCTRVESAGLHRYRADVSKDQGFKIFHVIGDNCFLGHVFLLPRLIIDRCPAMLTTVKIVVSRNCRVLESSTGGAGPYQYQYHIKSGLTPLKSPVLIRVLELAVRNLSWVEPRQLKSHTPSWLQAVKYQLTALILGGFSSLRFPFLCFR